MASDFIQLGTVAIAVNDISFVDGLSEKDAAVYVYVRGNLDEAALHLEGVKADAFRNWWNTKASVNVLWQEPADESPS